MTTRTISVDWLARVEGEGALSLRYRDGVLEEAHLSIFEPPRFFEAFMRGRSAFEAPDIAARICGICPVAYQLSALAALEDAWDVTVPEPVVLLRRLFLCAEWVASHALHVTMLHAPDFLGYPDAMAMAKDHPDAVRRGLAIKKVGNIIMEAIGGREIHPVNIRLGGFWRAPDPARIRALAADVDRAVALAQAAAGWIASLPFPDADMDYELVSIATPGAYPLAPGRIVSTRGIDIAPNAFGATFEEFQKPHSTALHSLVRGRGTYLTGPIARLALGHAHLAPLAAEAAHAAGIERLSRNPFMSILVRSIEILHALEEAAALIRRYDGCEVPAAPVEPRAARAFGVIEAPRGLLFQEYETDADGTVRHARIVPPTAQNQGSIEADLRVLATRHGDSDDATLRHLCEQAIRNHDPCISCATHFLRLDVERA